MINIRTISVKDLQFPKYFILNELNVGLGLTHKILNQKLAISSSGDANSVNIKDDKIIISSSTSILKFLSNVLYYSIKPYVNSGFQQDKLALSLLYICKNYVYHNYRKGCSGVNISVIIDLNKISSLSILLKDIVEPIIGKSTFPEVLVVHSNTIDACHISYDFLSLSKVLNINKPNTFIKYPVVILNENIHNNAAKLACLFYNVLNVCYGKKCDNIIKHILINNGNNSNILENIVNVLKITEGSSGFILDFIKYLKSNVSFTPAENKKLSENYTKVVNGDSFLKDNTRFAGESYTPQAFKQWHQWSMIVGLIEKQLQPMRGSMWPASENIKPFEDKFRKMISDRSKKKQKTQLNMEEMLEVSRELYNHRAVQPGNLYESLLKEDRVWKT